MITAEKDTILTLPPLRPAKYLVIANDIGKIESNSQRVIKLFYEKTFAEIFRQHLKLVEDFKHTMDITISSLYKSLKFEDSYRRNKAVVKAKNEFYFRSKKLLEEFKAPQLKELEEKLTVGIKWYEDKLANDIARFPQKLKVEYKKEDFKFRPEDSFELKWFKFTKRFKHLFAGYPITNRIQYREIAEYYLYDNRQPFLLGILKELQKSTLESVTQLNIFFIEFSNVLIGLEETADELNEEQIQELEQDKQQLDIISAKIESDLILFSNRFLLEFRKNLQHLSNDLENIAINQTSAQQKKEKKRYRKLIQANLAFPKQWSFVNQLTINKLYLDTILSFTKSRIKEEVNIFKTELYQIISLSYLKEIDTLKDVLKQIQEEGSADKTKIEFKAESTKSLVERFQHHNEEILKLIKELPDSLEISDNNPLSEGTLNTSPTPILVPVERITDHFIESRFGVPSHAELNKAVESLKKSNFTLKDMVNLARFNLANLNGDTKEEPEAIARTVNETTLQISEEQQHIYDLRQQLFTSINKNLYNAFESLSSQQLIRSTHEFSQFIRDYHSKRVITSVNTFTGRIRNFFSTQAVKLLYSKSQGVLLAQEITETDTLKASTSRILEITEAVSPKPEVLNQLPVYYKNLFSGRSNIGSDFWVPRKTEEEQAKKAVTRYNSGYKGGILVIGEKNAGKTALSRYIGIKHFKKEKVYQLFPPKEGSTSASTFEATLRKETGLFGTAFDMLGSIQYSSVIIINDLELWWERSETGWDVIDLILQLIDFYSEKCLFVINVNPHAYQLINTIRNINNYFISIIQCRPFGAEELRNLIMLRHRSSGLKYSLNGIEENNISEIRKARLFNAYFDISRGNPGNALNAWLSNIERVSGKTIRIKSPATPNLSALKKIEDDWVVYLVQFILHKRLTFNRLERILGRDAGEIRETLHALIRSGLITETYVGLYTLNSYSEPFITRYLKEKRVL